MPYKSIEETLQALGYVLPTLPTSKGIYKRCLVDRNHLYVSGHISVNTDGSSITGKLGKDLDEEQEFIPVIDAVPADGMNPLWEQVRIVFNPGFTPHQFTNDEQIDAAAKGPNPEITLIDTEEMYRCSVVAKPATE